MYKKILLVLIFALFIVPTVFASQSDLGNAKQNNCISLKQTCANCSFVNITSVLYPINKTQALGEVAMTKVGTEYNYTFCKTSVIGEYLVNGKGDPSGTIDIFVYNFNVTPTGDTRGISIFLTIAATAIILFIAATILRNPWLGFISGTMFLVLGVYTIIYGFANLAEFYTRAIGFVSIALGLLFTILAAYEWVVESNEGGEED